MDLPIAVLPGDGIGPEVTAAALRVLEPVAGKFGHRLQAQYASVGWAAIDECGQALPPATGAVCRRNQAILFGAVGLPDRDQTLPPPQRPERVALLELRRGLFANLRHIVLPPALAGQSPLKEHLLADGVDILIVRELTGGLYYGRPQEITGQAPQRRAVDTMAYSEQEIRRILKVGFESARRRRRRLASVEKANILATSALWREVARAMAADYPDVRLEHLYVDNASMQLLRRPGDFDVLVTENTFGDILSDEASMLAGSIGLVPSACLGEPDENGRSATPFYEPIHGSAPDIAGRNIANPVGAILSAAMMLEHTFGLLQEAKVIRAAVLAALRDPNYRTADLGGAATCSAMTDAVIAALGA